VQFTAWSRSFLCANLLFKPAALHPPAAFV
jgi:hypothetical protein